MKRSLRSYLWMGAGLAALLTGFLILQSAPTPAAAQTAQPAMGPTPQPRMPGIPDRLAPPPTVFPPTQADQGAQVYYLVCMACHGDKGQGLTAEWRNVLDPPENNCWSSHCHGPDHPDFGFALPKFVPAVISPGALARFQTAAEMHEFIQTKMPWQAPGTLKPDEYWQLTAFLLRANGVQLGSQVLNDQTAGSLKLHPSPAANAARPVPAGWLLAGGVGVVILIVLLVKYRRTNLAQSSDTTSMDQN